MGLEEICKRKIVDMITYNEPKRIKLSTSNKRDMYMSVSNFIQQYFKKNK